MTGIICVNKPKDITSFGVVAKIRGITGERKAGHTGTLDPMATGVLPVMLGGATRFLNYLPDSDKGYRAVFQLGIRTDTLDSTGTVISESKTAISKEEIESVLPRYMGKIMQTPPMYSAKSVDGVRLYDLARKGIAVERKACAVEIKSLSLVSYNNKTQQGVLDVFCSKGTYIRSLIDDIGNDLGCGAIMTELCRTSAMGFTTENCVTLDTLQKRKDSGAGFDGILIQIEDIFSGYESVFVSEAQAKRFSNGGALDLKRIKKAVRKGGIYRIYSCDHIFLGLGKAEKDEMKILRLLSVRD